MAEIDQGVHRTACGCSGHRQSEATTLAHLDQHLNGVERALRLHREADAGGHTERHVDEHEELYHVPPYAQDGRLRN